MPYPVLIDPIVDALGGNSRWAKGFQYFATFTDAKLSGSSSRDRETGKLPVVVFGYLIG